MLGGWLRSTRRCGLAAIALVALLAPRASVAAEASPHVVDETRARAAGIRKLESRRLTLYTDLPASKNVEELPAVFDQAFPQWCEYFGVDPARHADWHMTGYLMKERVRFEASGLLPADVPTFLNGWCRQHEFWFYNPTSEYYRRHLMLHEGTHGFMFTMLGNCGPPWYSEGIAEFMATHRWREGKLTMRSFPSKSADVSKLGRIEIVENDVASRHGKSLADVLAYDSHAHLKVEPYGWSWAAVAFLDGHPRYRDRFRKLWNQVNDDHFNRRLSETFGDDGWQIAEEWQVFTADIAYGYDMSRTAMDFTVGKPLVHNGTKVTVAADLGWQNSGIRLEGGKSYRLRAAGRYQVAKDSHIWWSEPGGVSIRYYHGKPLGVLLAALHPDGAVKGDSPFTTPLVVGLGTVVHPPKSGTLYFRTNISSGELDSAAGKLIVDVSRD